MTDWIYQNHTVTRLSLCCFVPKGTNRPMHQNRPNHGLAYKVSGVSRYIFDDGTELTLRPGQLLYLPKGSTYRVENIELGEWYAINFHVQQEDAGQPQVISVRSAQSFSRLFAEAEELWKRRLPGYRMQATGLLYSLLGKLQQENGLPYSSGEKLQRIRPAVDYLHENYTAEALRIDHLASLCGMTPEYFRQIFRNQFGTSPIKYINKLKVRRAEELLRSGLYTVTEAALMSGFSDMSHFSREFKKTTGKAPTIYRGSHPKDLHSQSRRLLTNPSIPRLMAEGVLAQVCTG